MKDTLIHDFFFILSVLQPRSRENSLREDQTAWSDSCNLTSVTIVFLYSRSPLSEGFIRQTSTFNDQNTLVFFN